MAENRMDQAMDRIEAALARIEAASNMQPQGDGALVARHEALRSSVAAALSELDTMIGALES